MNSIQGGDWRAEIAAVEERANAAFVNRDLEQLDHLFSDELVVNSPINRVNDKKKLLELLGSGAIGHVSSTIRHELIRRDGDLVVVMGPTPSRTRPPSRFCSADSPTSGVRKAIAGGSTLGTPM